MGPFSLSEAIQVDRNVGESMSKKWKWILGCSSALNLVLVIVLASTADSEDPIPLVQLTQQKIDTATDIQIGMSVTQLSKLMGKPVKRDAEKNIEEWFYCRTGINVDEYVQISIMNKKVQRINNYVVSSLDVGGLIGSCELFIKYTDSKKSPSKSGQQDAGIAGAST